MPVKVHNKKSNGKKKRQNNYANINFATMKLSDLGLKSYSAMTKLLYKNKKKTQRGKSTTHAKISIIV